MKEEILFLFTVVLLVGAAGVVGYLTRAAVVFRRECETVKGQLEERVAALASREDLIVQLCAKVERLQHDVAALSLSQGGRR